MKKSTTGPIVAILLLSLLLISYTPRAAKAAPLTVYIRADGTIDPPTAPISTHDYVVYTLTGNINGSIVIQRNNIALDGNGHFVLGASGSGIYAVARSYVAIRNIQIGFCTYGINLSNCLNFNVTGNTITNNQYGIQIWNSSSGNVLSRNRIVGNSVKGVVIGYATGNHIFENTIISNNYGVAMGGASGNIIAKNNVTENTSVGLQVDNSSSNNLIDRNSFVGSNYGIKLGSSGNSIIRNNITSNYYGIFSIYSSNNGIYHNNFRYNSVQTYCYVSSDIWDNGYPSGGNYWSNYNGTDFYHGVLQDIAGGDGIGDTRYVINSIGGDTSADYYPLRGQWGSGTNQGINSAVFPSNDLGLIFQNVITAGSTTTRATSVQPQGHPITGSRVGEFFDVKTSASYSGMITIRIQFYDPLLPNLTRESMYKSSLRLMHWDNSTLTWIDITTGIDAVSDVIYGQTDHLSIFGVTSIFGITGDTNVDGTVNVLDLIAIANHLGHVEGDGHEPNSSDWYKCMNTDVNSDGQHNILDLIVCAIHLGEHW